MTVGEGFEGAQLMDAHGMCTCIIRTWISKFDAMIALITV
jgi:hypothetical protein